MSAALQKPLFIIFYSIVTFLASFIVINNSYAIWSSNSICLLWKIISQPMPIQLMKLTQSNSFLDFFLSAFDIREFKTRAPTKIF